MSRPAMRCGTCATPLNGLFTGLSLRVERTHGNPAVTTWAGEVIAAWCVPCGLPSGLAQLQAMGVHVEASHFMGRGISEPCASCRRTLIDRKAWHVIYRLALHRIDKGNLLRTGGFLNAPVCNECEDASGIFTQVQKSGADHV
jgi:hypothetical protein